MVTTKTSFLLMFVLIFCFSSTVYALSPEEVLVVANQNAAKSKDLARYYMEKRQIPVENLVLLFMTDNETCSRKDYEQKAIPPIRRFLEKNTKIRSIVTIYGVPLKISSPGSTQKEKDQLAIINQKKQDLEVQLTSGAIIDLKIRKEKSDLLSTINNNLSTFIKRLDKLASFDSELCLVKLDNYDLNMWQPNPYYLGFKNQNLQIKKADVLMTSRLDGTSADIVKRIINDSIEAEQEGVKGSVGYHMASSECATLKQDNSQVWCKKMLDNGITATIGPVGEPYIQAFPIPELFFGFLIEGYLTLAESYLISLPYLSWKMVLVGDPLYRLNIKK
ncbi:MAG: TIGR03790 family protein [Proteobacteria bacterium]|nr:TIGR03790 family protein [Pseudomonadota bacterium]MBU1696018.1 TIGR03790 family protein [Pseudomonadota bacterium]